MNSKNAKLNGFQPTIEDHQAKINEIRRSLGPLPDKLSIYCSDASLARHLIARNWDVKKSLKMLKATLKWRHEYKPEEIRWEEVANEAETGKIYRSNFVDKHGRSVLVMRPGCQNTKSIKGQIRFLVYCMENAILNLPPDQEQMVWLIDYHGFSLADVSLKVTRETAHVLQDHYPERLGVAILYNPPKFFEPFWKVVKPFLETKTCAKVKFVYSDDPGSMMILEDLFDMDKLEQAFGGKGQGFDIHEYSERMRDDDKRMPLFWTKKSDTPSLETPAVCASFPDLKILEPDPDESVKGLKENASLDNISCGSSDEENGAVIAAPSVASNLGSTVPEQSLQSDKNGKE